MTRADSIFLPQTEFDAFLFAQIGEDENAMPFSVLSALARQDIDPWQEAAKLARLPRKIAAERLASLISAPPGGLAAHLDAAVVATRLIAFLPVGRSSSAVSPNEKIGLRVWADRRVIIVAIISIVVLGATWSLAIRQSQTHVHMDRAPSAGADSSRASHSNAPP
jgi:hypothetical protein